MALHLPLGEGLGSGVMVSGSEVRWRVGELAAATGVTVKALHHYDRLGLLVPAERTRAGHRLYAEGDVRRLYRVVALRELGLSLGEIASVLDRGQPGLRETVRSHLVRVEREIDSQQTLRRRLVGILELLESSLEPSVDQFLDAMEAMTVIDLGWLDGGGDDWEQWVRGALVDFEVTRLRAARLGADFVWQAEQQARGIEEAFAELGMLSAEEAHGWRERVVSEMAAAGEVTPPAAAGGATPRRASDHLARLLSEVSKPGGTDGGQTSHAELIFVRTLEALHKVGAVSDEDVSDWHERLATRAGRESPRERRTRATARNCSAVKLRRVLTGPGDPQDGLRVTSVELYGDGVVVRWHLPVELNREERALAPRERRLRAEEARREALPDFALTDDCETTYAPIRGWPLGLGIEHFGDEVQVINWQTVFSPAPPRAATRLEFADGTRRHFSVQLPTAAGT